MKIIKYIFPIITLFPLFTSCGGDDPNIKPVGTEDSIYIFIDDVMHSFYLWYDEVPDVDPTTFNSPQLLLEDLKVPIDKWSFVDKAETVMARFEEGEYFGFGFYFRFDESNNLYIPLVYESSTAYSQGIRKGDRIEKINGIVVSQFRDFDSFFDDRPVNMTFEIRGIDNISKTYSLSKEVVVQNAVFYKNIFDVSGKKTGYIVYDSFLGYSLPELEEAFENFAQNDIEELIVDLRYNGGGYISIAKYLAEIIAPAAAVEKPLYSFIHNDLIGPYYDTTVYFEANDLNLDLERVFFITTQNSASASELVINCLEPYMDVFLIGAPTHGKPVGMSGLLFQDWLLYPVTNLVANAEGFSDYFDGLPVDKQVGEGLDKAWGDVSDPGLSEVIYYITNGSFNSETSPGIKSSLQQPPFLSDVLGNSLIIDR